MSTLPKVVIVGRTNVGKSTLFNRLSDNVKSITLDYEGVTRDFLTDTVCWKGRCFELIDTGGVSVPKKGDSILEQSRDIALSLFEKADVVIFVVDGKVGILQEDRNVAKLLHKLGKKVICAVNKIDTNIAQEQLYEFERLGLKPLFPISAQHGTGVGDVLDEIVVMLPPKKVVEEKKPTTKIALLGKPNVGKSSLMNLLLQQDRAIVSPIAGTTREALAGDVTFYQEDIRLTDTPGVRRKRGVTEKIETMMVKSALRAIEDADVVLLLIDVTEAQIADQELKLAFYTFDKLNKALILLFNKHDLMNETMKGDLERSLSEYKFFLKKIEQLTISCEHGKNIGRVMPMVQKVAKRHAQRFDDEELSMFLKEALFKKPLYHNKALLRFYRAKQTGVSPITISLFVNQPSWFGPSQLAYLEGRMRRNYDLKSVPIKFVVRKRAKG